MIPARARPRGVRRYNAGMTADTASRLPDDLAGRLGLARTVLGEDLGVMVCTVDAAGRPHPAMLSPLEIVALDPGRLRLVTYPASRTAAHLAADGRVTLMFVDSDLACYVKGTARPAAPPGPDGARFEVRLDEVTVDRPDVRREGPSRITSGIRIARPVVEEEEARQRLAWLAKDPP